MKKDEIKLSAGYSTQDLHEAAAIAVFVKPLRLEKTPSHFLFVFPKDQAEGISAKYWTGDLSCSLRAYVLSLQSMKDWLFSIKRANGWNSKVA
jgi:hypothetical protein